MHFRKKSSATNSLSNDCDKNELTTYTYCTRKTNLNDSYFTSISDKKEKDKDKSTVSSIRTSRENATKELKRACESEDKEIGKYIERESESDSGETQAKSNEIKIITNENANMKSLVKINVRRKTNRNRPPLPTQNLIKPSKTPDTKKLSLQEKLFNYVEARLNQRNKSSELRTEGSQTTSENNPTTESEENLNINRSYFSFKANDSLVNPIIPKLNETTIYQKSQKRSNSKILNTIKKLTNSFKPVFSEGDANIVRTDFNNISDKYDKPIIRLEKEIRIGRRMNQTEESREINRYNTNFINESEQDAVHPSNILNHINDSGKIKTITINRKGVINLSENNMNETAKEEQLSKIKRVTRIQAILKGYLFRLRLFHSVIKRKDNKHTFLSKIIYNYHRKAQMKILKNSIEKWSNENEECSYIKFVPSLKKKLLMKLYHTYSNRKIKNSLNKFFKCWMKKILNFRGREEKLTEIFKKISKRDNFKLWRIKKNYIKRSLDNSQLTFLIKLKILFISKNFQIKHFLFNNLKSLRSKIKKKEDDVVNFNNKLNNIQKNKKKSYLTNLLFKIKILSLQRQIQKGLFKNIIHKFDEKIKSQILQRTFVKWIKIIHKSIRNTKLIGYYKEQHGTEVISAFSKSMKKSKTANLSKLLLSKIIINLSNKSKTRLNFFFIIWKKKIIEKGFYFSSLIIQKFLRLKIKFRLSKMKENSAEIEKFSYRNKAYLKASDKLAYSMQKILLKYSFNRLQREVIRRGLIQFVVKIRNMQLKNFQHSLRKIKRFVQIKTVMTNAYARKIQQFYRLIKFRKGILYYIRKLKSLKKIIFLMTDRNFRNLNKTLKFWRKISMNNTWEQSAKIIQSYLSIKLEKLFIQKQNYCKKCLCKIFRDYLVFRHLKPYFKQFAQSVRKELAIQHVKRHYAKYFLCNFKLNCELGTLGRVLLLLTKKRKINLEESLLRIKKHSDDYERIQSIRKIQKYYKRRLFVERKEKIQLSISKILNQMFYKNKNITRNVLSKWLKTCNDYKIIVNAKTITDFIREKMTVMKYRKIWNNFKGKIILKHTLKFFVISLIIQKIMRPFLRRNYKIIKIDFFTKKRNNLLRFLINKNFNKNCNKNLEKKFINWRLKAENLNIRDEYLIDMFKILYNLQRKLFSFHVFTALKLHSLRLVLHKKILYKSLLKIQSASETKLDIEKLCKNLIKAEANIEINLKKTLKNKIYKLFAYKVLNSFVKFYIQKEKIQDLKESKLFLRRLKENLIEYNNYTNIIRHRYKSINKFTKKKFSEKTNSLTIKLKNVIRKNEVAIFLVPILNKLFMKLKKNRNQTFLSKINLIRKISQFCEIFNRIEKSLLPIEDFLGNLKRICYISKLHSNFVIDILENSKKKFLSKCISSLKITNKITKLMYVIQLTNMHKKIADYKFIQIIIRKWAFYSHMRNLSRKKLSAIYQDFKTNYINSSEEIFNELNEKEEYEDYKNIFDVNSRQLITKTDKIAKFEN